MAHTVVCHKGLLFPMGCRLQMRAELRLCSPPVAHGFHHTGHEMWTGFLNNPQSRWLSRFQLCVISKGPWTTGGAFGPSLFISVFATGHRAWGRSQLLTFVSQCSSFFLRVILLMVLATQLTAVLRAGSRVNFDSFRQCFNTLPRRG
jgi:hypothetical protein